MSMQFTHFLSHGIHLFVDEFENSAVTTHGQATMQCDREKRSSYKLNVICFVTFNRELMEKKWEFFLNSKRLCPTGTEKTPNKTCKARVPEKNTLSVGRTASSVAQINTRRLLSWCSWHSLSHSRHNYSTHVVHGGILAQRTFTLANMPNFFLTVPF